MRPLQLCLSQPVLTGRAEPLGPELAPALLLPLPRVCVRVCGGGYLRACK